MPLISEFATLAGMYLGLADHFKGTGKCAFSRKVDGAYVETSHDELREQVEAFALALRSLGLKPGDRVGIMSENRLEFIVADLACVCSGIADVSIFTILTPKQVEYIFNNAEVKAVICSNRLQLGKLVKVAADLPTLEHIICFQQEAIDQYRTSTTLPILSFDALIESGRAMAAAAPGELTRMAARVAPDDLATLIYTSGTTGNPKGVMLTHSNFVANITGASRVLPIGPDDVILSYLPLCHSFERTAGYYTCFACGASIAFAESLETVSVNLLEVRPTIMTSVPRGFERIKTRVERKAEAEPESKRKLIRWALGVGVERFRRINSGRAVGPVLAAKHLVADRLVFSKIRQATGGRVRFFVSGGSALSRDVGEFFFGIGMNIIEGYGMTECSPIISANRMERPKLGTVGQPLFNVEVTIAPDGEILTRGPHVMKGYFRDPEATAEAIDDEGWLHTGDIGEFDAEGYLRITDRKKHIIVSSGGKNIAPGPIEDLVSRSRLVDQVMLVGENRPYMTALIVPDFEVAREMLLQAGESPGDVSTAVGRESMVDGVTLSMAVEQELKELQRDLSAFERVRRFTLLAEPFSVENGLLTPTLKVKRKAAIERYGPEIEKMYEGAEE
ncbi:MAG TPA: long-chain fatty acid--CoA ligase [Candidatus Kapabacteria bacterium]|nr:long-chain fatty acid--CoA ligase [Candidatus Kapabacteria bacterium]